MSAGSVELFIGPHRELSMLVRRRRSKWYRLSCFGRKRHYRKNGSCRCVADILAALPPDVRALTRVEGWGGKQPPP